jgi:hypothetical protein
MISTPMDNGILKHFIDDYSSRFGLETRIGLLTGLYEKVINVKADVAAVLVSATKRREWR